MELAGGLMAGLYNPRLIFQADFKYLKFDIVFLTISFYKCLVGITFSSSQTVIDMQNLNGQLEFEQ